MSDQKKVSANEAIPISDYETLKSEIREGWVEQDTAILVIHGIGNQNPLETLDGFARGLLETYCAAGQSLTLEHQVAKKAESGGTPWFDNFLRIRKEKGGPALDIYEYYWAHETEGQASFADLTQWLNNVTSGARKFYKENVKFGVENEDRSIFVQNGKFRPFPYWLCVNLIPHSFVFLNWLIDGLIRMISSIPFIGPVVSLMAKGNLDGTLEKLSNVLNDISIYNTTDVKSKFFRIRNCILDGAVNALRYLLETKPASQDGEISFKYKRVLLVGHSLGTQIAFDTINRINHLVNQGEIKGYDKAGKCELKDEPDISKRLIGLVTFGSPLDKIAFFFREQVPPSEYLRFQMIHHFHGFKQRNWDNLEEIEKAKLVQSMNVRLFDAVPWRNYFDNRDYVSGSLDYYLGVTNINCKFKSKWYSFTHSDYWACSAMHAEIIKHFLAPAGKRGIVKPIDAETEKDSITLGAIA
jgi:hypothetical protein